MMSSYSLYKQTENLKAPPLTHHCFDFLSHLASKMLSSVLRNVLCCIELFTKYNGCYTEKFHPKEKTTQLYLMLLLYTYKLNARTSTDPSQYSGRNFSLAYQSKGVGVKAVRPRVLSITPIIRKENSQTSLGFQPGNLRDSKALPCSRPQHPHWPQGLI